MSKLFVIVTYDVQNDRRRNKIHKKLKGFGEPVQYSVFECVLSSQEFEKMKSALKKLIENEEDSIRYYSICTACLARAKEMNGKVVQIDRTRFA